MPDFELPEPKTFKEWAVAMLLGYLYPQRDLEPKTPIEQYLNYKIENEMTTQE